MPSFTSRFSYANVVATLALFIALGGASYAAVELPAGSVGTPQLKPASVTPSKLAFPLAAVGTTDSTSEDLPRLEGCNAPAVPGRFPPGITIKCPELPAFGAPRPVVGEHRGLTLRVSKPAQLLVEGVAQLRNEAPDGTAANVTAEVTVDGEPTAQPWRYFQLAGQGTAQMPLETVVRVAAGRHHVAVLFAASYSSYLPGDVDVTPVTLTATAVPQS